MALEMSLPHAPRIQQVAADGTEAVAQDEQQWQLYFTVQQALQAQQVGGKTTGWAEAQQLAHMMPLLATPHSNTLQQYCTHPYPALPAPGSGTQLPPHPPSCGMAPGTPAPQGAHWRPQCAPASR